MAKRTESRSRLHGWLQRHPWVLLPVSVLVPSKQAVWLGRHDPRLCRVEQLLSTHGSVPPAVGIALVLYGIVPLGKPDSSLSYKLPKILVVNPVVYSIYALMVCHPSSYVYLNVA